MMTIPSNKLLHRHSNQPWSSLAKRPTLSQPKILPLKDHFTKKWTNSMTQTTPRKKRNTNSSWHHWLQTTQKSSTSGVLIFKFTNNRRRTRGCSRLPVLNKRIRILSRMRLNMGSLYKRRLIWYWRWCLGVELIMEARISYSLILWSKIRRRIISR